MRPHAVVFQRDTERHQRAAPATTVVISPVKRRHKYRRLLATNGARSSNNTCPLRSPFPPSSSAFLCASSPACFSHESTHPIVNSYINQITYKHRGGHSRPATSQSYTRERECRHHHRGTTKGTRPATSQSYRQHQKVILPPQHMSPRPSSHRNVRDFYNTNQQEPLKETPVKRTTPAQYGTCSCLEVRLPRLHNKPQSSCYRSFFLASREERKESKSGVPQITWGMPEGNTTTININEGKHSWKQQRQEQTTETRNVAYLPVAPTVVEEQKEQGREEQEEGWIILKRPLPMHHDSVLSSEKDVRNLIKSCDHKSRVIAIHIGKNLHSRFAHVRVSKKANLIILKHRGSLGREFGRWDNVTAEALTKMEAPTFSFFCDIKNYRYRRKARRQEV